MSEPDRTADVAYIPDHTAQGLDSFYRQFRNSPDLQALAKGWLDQVQAIEDAAWQVLTQDTIEGTGVALDRVGSFVGLPRGNVADDDAYRRLLRAMILARRASGTGPDLIAVLRQALGTTDFTMSVGRTAVIVEPASPLGFDPYALLFVLKVAKLAGVQLQLFDPPLDLSLLFTCGTSEFFMQTDYARGFADAAQTVGGTLTGVIT